MVPSPQGDPSPIWKSKWEAAVNQADKLCHTCAGFAELRERCHITSSLEWILTVKRFGISGQLDIIWKSSTFESWLTFKIEHSRGKLGWFTLLQFKFQLVVKTNLKSQCKTGLLLVSDLSVFFVLTFSYHIRKKKGGIWTAVLQNTSFLRARNC